MRLLLAAGAEPNARDQYGITPLFCAARDGGAAQVMLLLECGADPTLRSDNGQCALDWIKSCLGDADALTDACIKRAEEIAEQRQDPDK